MQRVPGVLMHYSPKVCADAAGKWEVNSLVSNAGEIEYKSSEVMLQLHGALVTPDLEQ